MDSLDVVRRVTSHTGRVAGSDAERRAAREMEAVLGAGGGDARIEPIVVRPRFALAHAIAAAIAVGGGVLSVAAPVPGLALAAGAALSTLLDVLGVAHIARRLTPVRASQNVVSEQAGGRAGRLILVAPTDAPRSSAAFFRLGRRLGDPWAVIVAAMIVVAGCAALRVVGVDSSALTAVQFVPTALLIVVAALLVDVELTAPDAGEAQAAALATVARLAGEHLEHFDVDVVLTGASASFGLGMRRWLRGHRKSLDAQRTVVIDLTRVGDGDLRYARRMGPLRGLRAHSELVRLCAEIAEDDGHGPRPAPSRHPGDGAAALWRGLPALTIWAEGDRPSQAGLDHAHAFCRELLARLDAEVGPRVSGGAPAAEEPVSA